ncbi:MAG: alpha/beta fold hydrolase [Candidatus Obscuribacterales bacterium]|nr:alpha/beta fold hydrolase [Candidatus Obscuribacterales bacterium]
MTRLKLLIVVLILLTLQAFVPSLAEDSSQRDQALDYIDANEFEKAETILKDLARSGDCDALMDHAACHFRRDAYVEAREICQQAMKKAPGQHYTKSMVRLGSAECYYKQSLFKDAEREFEESLSALTKNDAPIIPILALEGLGGCYEAQQRYQEAVKTFEELVLLNRAVYGSEDIGYGWALLQLGDAYRKAGENEKARAINEKSVWIFRQNNFIRLSEECKAAGQDSSKLRKYIFGLGDNDKCRNSDSIVSGDSKYRTIVSSDVRLPRCAWVKQLRQVDAPGWAWVDPGVPLNTVLVCIHGLGLHHRSYESFAKRIAPEGIATVSLDVRGFGTYLASKGQDALNIADCVADMKMVLSIIRRDNPDVPLFLLGESMGGAIALRVGAESPELIDGVICSVPSGSRYKGTATALSVGLHYLSGKNKPINIGEQVIKQATTETALRESWSSDPSARLKLTPKELVHFNNFMDQNIDAAKKLCKLPVIFFQGDDDKLVKKTGTYDLFEALATNEKTLVLLGHTQHLIFEAGQFRDDVTLGVIGWMNAHGRNPSKKSID